MHKTKQNKNGLTTLIIYVGLPIRPHGPGTNQQETTSTCCERGKEFLLQAEAKGKLKKIQMFSVFFLSKDLFVFDVMQINNCILRGGAYSDPLLNTEDKQKPIRCCGTALGTMP